MVTSYNDPRVGTAIPRKVVVGTASVLAVPQNLTRRRLVLVNDSDTAIYLSKGYPAILNAGIRLNANGGAVVDEPDEDGHVFTGNWFAISSAATKNLCISEE